MAPRAIVGIWNVGHLVDYVMENCLLNKGDETPHQVGIVDDDMRRLHLPRWEKGLH